jgi:predicted DNA-binding protein (MmcQ/YjbR family)
MPAITPTVALTKIRTFALAYPDAVEEFPWGDRVIKVRGKIFVFLGVRSDGGFGIGAKLPASHELALTLPYVTPTGYGLGKAGWVTAHIPTGRRIDVELFCDWIDESYRTVAPKTLVKALDAREVGPATGVRGR